MEEPWLTEPDSEEWQDPITGYTCYIKRHSTLKHLCGYVRLPEGHPFIEVDYSAEVPEAYQHCMNGVPVGKRGVFTVLCASMHADSDGNIRATPELLCDVHGSLTFAGVPLGQTEGFWYGFDCSHAGDLTPYRKPFSDEVYRDFPFVKAECTSLAKQLYDLVR